MDVHASSDGFTKGRYEGRVAAGLVRPVTWMSAGWSADPTSRTYYDKQRNRGKTHTQALLRLARQRISVLFAMLRDGTFYESRTPADVELAA
jgi:hypothetical protein